MLCEFNCSIGDYLNVSMYTVYLSQYLDYVELH